MENARKLSSTDYPYLFLMVSSADHISGVTGLTPVVSISKNGGAFAAAQGAVSEIGNGIYSIAGNATDRNTLGEIIIKATGASADTFFGKMLIVAHDPIADPLSAAVPGSYAAGSAGYQLGRIGSANATVSQPWSSTDQLQLKQGDDYSADEGRQITKTFSNLPDISSATVKFKARFNDGTTFQKTMTVSSATVAYLELTSAETDSFATGLSYFDMEITYVNSHVVTPVDNGELFITADI